MKNFTLIFMIIWVSFLFAGTSIVGDMNVWNTADPLYDLNENANGVWELTKTLVSGSYEYKVVEGDSWGDENYPGNNQVVSLATDGDVTWKVNLDANLVTHMNPVIAGDFISEMGGTDWDPSDLTGEMTDPDGDDIFTWRGLVPAGDYDFKVTFNHNWDQSTGGNVQFISDGITETEITYDMSNNTTETNAAQPPSATITFIIDDSAEQTYSGFYLKGTWITETGNYDIGWNDGAEHTAFYDDGTNGDENAGDNIWTAQQDLVSDGGSNTWEWGINDSDHNWLDGNFQFSVVDDTPQTLTYDILGGTSQDVTVTFQIYMEGLELGWYENGVSIQGNTLPLDWEAGSNELTPEADLYVVDIIFPAGSPYDVEYKFARKDGDMNWSFETFDGNRNLVIDDSESTQTIQIHYWNNVIPEPEVTIMMDGDDADLTWENIPGTSYNVFADVDPEGSFETKLNLLPLANHSFTHSDVNETKYFYKVIAFQQ